MPHLVERDHDLIGCAARLGNLAGFVMNPVQDGDVADAEDAGNAAKAHVAHSVEQHRQSLHLRWFASRRCPGEIASAGLASVALHLAHDTILPIIDRTAALAADIRHGGLVLPCRQRVATNMVKCIIN
jgi:hypothetical protein